MAADLGVPYHVPVEDSGTQTPFANEPLPDGSTIDLGAATLEILAIKMPGHTPGSTCIHIPGHLILTGDTVFVRGLGRPDLTGKASELATELFHTIHDRLAPLDRATKVMPAHWTLMEEINDQGMVETTLGKIFEAIVRKAESEKAAVGASEASSPFAEITEDDIDNLFR